MEVREPGVCVCVCVYVHARMVGGELTASLCGKGCPFLLCQFKLFTSGQWKEYSKIKNASGPGRPWIHVRWKQPWEEEGLPALLPGVGWASGGFSRGCFSAG